MKHRKTLSETRDEIRETGGEIDSEASQISRASVVAQEATTRIVF
jgi:hypothetical protein